MLHNEPLRDDPVFFNEPDNNMMNKDFESFLTNKYAKFVNHTEDNINDEDILEEKFNEWLFNLEPDRWIKYANEYKNSNVLEALKAIQGLTDNKAILNICREFTTKSN